MVPIPAWKGRVIWLGGRRVLAVYRASGVLQEAIRLHQIGCGTAIGP